MSVNLKWYFALKPRGCYFIFFKNITWCCLYPAIVYFLLLIPTNLCMKNPKKIPHFDRKRTTPSTTFITVYPVIFVWFIIYLFFSTQTLLPLSVFFTNFKFLLFSVSCFCFCLFSSLIFLSCEYNIFRKHI